MVVPTVDFRLSSQVFDFFHEHKNSTGSFQRVGKLARKFAGQGALLMPRLTNPQSNPHVANERETKLWFLQFSTTNEYCTFDLTSK